MDNNLSNTFSLFQLESKSYKTKQCWSYTSYHIIFLGEKMTMWGHDLPPPDSNRVNVSERQLPYLSYL